MKPSFLLLLCIAIAVTSIGQSPILKVTGEYFRSEPFNTDFSAFLKHLLNDPTLSEKVIEKRTDSSLFFFEGTYSRHNPYFFKPVKTKVILVEMAIETDSAQIDTIYNYQLLSFAEPTDQGKKDIKKEFDKILKRFKSSFSKTTVTENADTSLMASITYNFFHDAYLVAPFALTLAGPFKADEMCLILTVRMSVINNRARLPVSLYGL
jgi:hypothetical protein